MQINEIQPIKPLELMNGKFDDFIGVWDKFVPPVVCKKLIDWFDSTMEEKETSNNFAKFYKHDEQIMDGVEQFHSKNLGRKDLSLIMNQTAPAAMRHEMNQYLQACFLDYLNEYGQLASTALVSVDQKMQKTSPGGGYHVWHYENSSYEMSARELVWMIYLNELPDGEGETEFLYQKRRIKPVTGTVVIWPAAFTHVHRGLTVYTKDKYILTGWYLKTL